LRPHGRICLRIFGLLRSTARFPHRDEGIYTKMAGRPAMDVLAEIGGQAAAIITYFF
jgi:hypothetical protein